ncbi:mechanosensitive ion channel family protein [Natrialbaceae archaeon A-gly3]
MLEVLTAFDRLSEQFTTTNARLVVTVVVAAVSVGVLVTSRSLQRWLNERSRPLYADVATTIVLFVTAITALAVILGVWGQTEEVRALYDRYDLGGEFLAKVIVSFVVLVSAYILTRFVRRLLREVFDSSSAVTEHHHEITQRMAQVVLWSVTLVFVLSFWTDDLGGLLVGAGFLGIVLGMAAQQTLGSLIAGFVLMFSRPFEIGDWIEIDDHEGIVTDISIVDTRIQTFDGECVVVPNDVIGSSMVTNRSKNGRLRIDVEVGVDYEADVDRARELAVDAVSDLEAAASSPPPSVVTTEFGDSAIVLAVRFWTENPNASRVARARTAAISAIKERFEAEGVTIPYPQRELSSRDGAGSPRVADDADRKTPPSRPSENE